MTNILFGCEIIVAIGLVVLILLQAGDAGIANIWSGGGETYHVRRGVEKMIFIATIVMAILFVALAIGILVIS